MWRLAWVWIVLVAAACGQLPSLPNDAVDRVPAELEFNGLSLAVGFEGAGTTVQPEAILAGTAVEAMFTVRAQDGLPLAGALIQFGVKTERWERVLDFPLGTSCTTDTQGECSTVLRSEGRAGAVQLEARVAGLESQWTNLMVLPAEGQAQVLVEIEGLGTYNWETGQGVDPLDNESTRLVLDKNQPKGVALQVRLLDPYDNPLVGLPVSVVVLAEETQVARPDAGPLDAASVDSSGADAQARSDLGAQVALDTAAPVDAGAGQDSGAAGDAGGNKVLNLTASAEHAMVALATAEGCPDDLEGGAQLSANAQADGYARFCVLPGQVIGDFTLRIEPASLFRSGDATSMQLRGETRAGAPSGVVYVPSHETEEGETIRLGCLPGGLSAVATFRVENDQGFVPNVRVKFAHSGGLNGLTSALEVSDQQGLVQVQAICPAGSLAGGSILADLAETDADIPASVGVQVRTDGVDEITIVEHGAWPPTLRSGEDPLTLRFQALNEAGAPVLRAGLMPVNDAPDNRAPLSFVVTIASAGHAGRVLLDSGDGQFTQPLVEQTVFVDQDAGAADFRFKLQSPATYGNPIILRVFEPGSQKSETRTLHVAPGPPSHITVSPSGTINAELLGAAGSFAFSVWDGDPAQGANRVPDVPISVAVPRSFVFLRGSNLTDIPGRTGNDGRFVVDVLQAQPIGDHTLEGSIIVGEDEQLAAVRVSVGAGEVASALEVRLDGEALPVITPEGGEALPTLTMRGGTSLAQTLTFRIVNRFGGGMPNLGLMYTLEQGVDASCASFDDPNITDERGEVTYGPGNQDLTAGGEVTDCVYRFAHGNTAAVQRLRVRQVPGLPQRATLTLTLRDGENDAGAVTLRNHMDAPGDWTDDAISREVVLQAWDANNLAPAGLRMWLDVINCFVNRRSADLDEQGRAVFRVAGGPDAQANCQLTARYFNEVGGDQPYVAPTLAVAGGGFDAPTLTAIDFRGNGPWLELSDEETVYVWGVSGEGIRGPGNWVGGECDDEGQCTYAQIVELSDRYGENFEREVLSVVGTLPLSTTVQGGERSYTVRVPQSAMGSGRWLGIRLKDPGQDNGVQRASRFVEFFALPPVAWTAAAPGGQRSVNLSLDAGDLRIKGGHRINLDDDPEDEFVLCGQLTNGRGMYAVVDRDQEGRLPSEEVPVVVSFAEGTEYDNSEHNTPENACHLADMDNDGRLDLVLPGPRQAVGSNNRFVGFTIHRGVAEGFFDPQGQSLVWEQPALANSNSAYFRLKTGPASIETCLSVNAQTCTRRVDLALSWDGVNNRFVVGGYEILGDSPVPSVFEQLRMGDISNQRTGETVSERGGGGSPVLERTIPGYFVTMSPDGAYVVVREDLMGLGLYRVADGVRVQRFGMPHGQFALTGSFNADQSLLAVGGEPYKVLVFNINLDNPEQVSQPAQTLEAPMQNTNVVRFNPSGSLLASAGNNNGQNPGQLRIWNTNDWSQAWQPQRTVGDNEVNQEAQWLDWSADGTYLALGHNHNDVRAVGVWHYAERSQTWWNDSLIRADYVSFTVHPDGSRVGVGARDNNLYELRFGDGTAWPVTDGPNTPEGMHDWCVGWPKAIFYPSNRGLHLIGGYGGCARLKIFRTNPRRKIHQIVYTPEISVIAATMTPGYDYMVVGLNDSRGVLVYRTESMGTGDYHREYDLAQQAWWLSGHDEQSVDVARFTDRTLYFERPMTWRSRCGNGVVDPGEAFDDGQPWEVSEYSYSCGAVCGDGVVQGGEDCDDDNDSNTDACTNLCRQARCGDGIVRQDIAAGEEGFEGCDDQNDNEWDGCDSSCNGCGDGQRGNFEGCDDGNDVVDDGCTNCRLATCGDGQLDEGEECDDGNQVDDDGCAGTCVSRCRYFEFDGVDDYVIFNGHNQDGERTLEVWTQGLDEGEVVRVSTMSMALTVTANGFTLQAFLAGNGTGDSILYEPVLPDWLDHTRPVHYAMTFYNNQHIQFFANGRLVGTGGQFHNQSTLNFACIGATRLLNNNGNNITSYPSRIRSIRMSSARIYTDPFTPDLVLSAQNQTLLLYRAQDRNRNMLPDQSGRNDLADIRGGTEVEWGSCQ